MVRLFAPLMLVLSTAVSGILATPTPAAAAVELAKRDVPALLSELGQLHQSVVTFQEGAAAITSTSSPQDVANVNVNIEAVTTFVNDVTQTAGATGRLGNADAANVVAQFQDIVAEIVAALDALTNDVGVIANTVAGPILLQIASLVSALGASLDALQQSLVADVNPASILLVGGLVQAKTDADAAATVAQNAYLHA